MSTDEHKIKTYAVFLPYRFTSSQFVYDLMMKTAGQMRRAGETSAKTRQTFGRTGRARGRDVGSRAGGAVAAPAAAAAMSDSGADSGRTI